MNKVFNLEEFIEDHNNNYTNYFEAIIFPDGHVEYSIPSHTHKLYMIWGVPEDQLYGGEKYLELQSLMPMYASPLSWLCNKTNCVVCWYNQSLFPLNYTQEQVNTFNRLVESKCIYAGSDIDISIEDLFTSDVYRTEGMLEDLHFKKVSKLCSLKQDLNVISIPEVI